METSYRLSSRLKMVDVPAASELDGLPLAETQLGAAFGINVLAIQRAGERTWLPGSGDPLRAGDSLLVEGREEDFALLEAFQGLEPLPPGSTISSLSTEEHGFADFMLEPRSRHLGATPNDLQFRQRYGLNVTLVANSYMRVPSSLVYQCPEAPEMTRGFRLKSRLAVNGIQ